MVDKISDEDKRLHGKTSKWSKVANALSGLGAGIQGRGAQFQQAMEADRQRLSLDRQRAAALDLMKLKGFVEGGNIGAAQGLLTERAQMIEELGGDPSDTIRFSHIVGGVQNGDPAAMQMLQSEINSGLEAAYSAGVIDDPSLDSRLDASTRGFRALTEGMTEEEMELAKRIRLGLAPRAGTTSGRQTIEIGGVPYVFDPNTGGYLPANVKGENVTAGDVAASEAEIASEVTAAEQNVERTGKVVENAFASLKDINSFISNYNDAISQVKAGAATGKVASLFPSFREASVKLDNIQNQLGLNVIGTTTFGALSESELAFALDTALPTDLQGPDLIEWLERKKKAQEKLQAFQVRAVKFFDGNPKRTLADFLDAEAERVGYKGDPDGKSSPILGDADLLEKYGG